MLGGLFGRSSLSASARRASSAQNRVTAARDKVEDLQSAIDDLRIELDEEAAAIREQWESRASATSTLEVPLEKSDVKVSSIGLVWIPMGPAGAPMGQTAP
jgi:phage host-nuclease inhibitor protein Gam